LSDSEQIKLDNFVNSFDSNYSNIELTANTNTDLVSESSAKSYLSSYKTLYDTLPKLLGNDMK
jgi:hypothetical protein